MDKNKSYTVDEALTRMQSYCAYRDRCHMEVENKLREMRMIPQACEVIITKLIEDDFLNETRFAQSFTRGKFRIKHWGKTRIIRELKQRQIGDYIIKKALKEINENDYVETFHQLADKRLKQLEKDTDYHKKRRRFISYLQYRGWESNLIFEKWHDYNRNKE
ncbi:MAG TPA: regulatory protein RecX [Flavobacteriaceae bacterium]|nr:regulatory protein RecX [Flavobacteriaceae bacterium]